MSAGSAPHSGAPPWRRRRKKCRGGAHYRGLDTAVSRGGGRTLAHLFRGGGVEKLLFGGLVVWQPQTGGASSFLLQTSTARCPPTGGGLCPPMGGQGRTASARTTSANIPPRPSTHPNLGALRGGGVTSGLFRWGDRRTSSARGMIGRTTSASLVSLRGRRAQHEYEPVHTPPQTGGASSFLLQTSLENWHLLKNITR